MGCCNKVVGAAKALRAEVGLRVVQSDALVKARRAACESCPKWDHGRCTVCQCYTWAKSRLPKENCPEGRWPSPTDAAFADKH